jgi:hypothetical protein
MNALYNVMYARVRGCVNTKAKWQPRLYLADTSVALINSLSNCMIHVRSSVLDLVVNTKSKHGRHDHHHLVSSHQAAVQCIT